MKNWLVTLSKYDNDRVDIFYMTVYATDYGSAFDIAMNIKYKIYANDVVKVEEV
jgi:hypothetical protein